MNKNGYINNDNFHIHNYEKKKFKEKININLSQIEKDIFILINYIRTNPLEFSKNFQNKQNEECMEIINFLKDIYNKEMLVPFEEIPEISAAARNLLINIALNDKKYHNLNLKNIKPETLNLRTRLSNYGHRTGRIFETVVFNTDNPEDIVNHILIDEKGRNMLLSNKMKYIGVACDILPSNIICSVIDIVQDFIPYNNNSEVYHNAKFENNYEKYDNYNNYDLKGQYYINNKNNEYPRSSINDYNYDNNIDNLKLKLDVREKDINENNNPNMNIIINNNHEEYIPNLFLNKHSNQRKNNIYLHNNEYYKTPKKSGSMDISGDKKNYFSPRSINSYNIIINNKIIPRKNNSNNINLIKKSVNSTNTTNNNKNNDDDKNIFTMAGRTCKEQQEVIEISSKMNLNKSKSVCSFDFNLNNSKLNNKSKFQRLNPKEKLEILHKINQRNKNPKSLSTNNKELEKIKNSNNSFIKKNSYKLNIDDNKRNISSYFINNGDYNLNFDFDKNNEYCNTNRVNTCASKMNDSSNLANFFKSPSYNESKSNFEFNEEYSKHKINEIKNDLLIFKDQIKKELKDEVKNEIKAEIKSEISINQNKKKPNSIKVEQDYEIKNMINNKRKMNKDDNSQNNNKINLIDDEIYYKKKNSNYFIKNKVRNRCSSEEKFIYAKNNINISLNNNDKERRSFNPQIYAKNIVIENNMKDKYRKSYEQLNDKPNNIPNNINYSVNQYNMNNNNSNALKKNSYYNDGHKAKNKQQIKKLIRLYNIAKDSKRNQSKFINDNIYDIINNNKSISNICFDNNNKNNNNENTDNTEKDNNNISKNKKKENIFIKGYIFQKKYERVKPKGNFYKYIKNNSNKNSVSSNAIIHNIEEKNKTNDYKKEKNEYLSINENNKGKENVNKGTNNYNSINDILQTGKFIEEKNNNTNKNLNDNMSIKSYADKNMIYKKERRKERNPSATFISNSEKNDIINIIKNNIDNEGKYLENYNLKTPNQTQKIKQYEINYNDNRSNISTKSNNNKSKTTSFYNDNIPYQCFPLNYTNINNHE